MKNHLLLKWGTVKGWDFESTECEAFKLLQKYMKGNDTIGCATDNPGKSRKKLLCDVIDKFDGEIQNDWTGEYMTKEEAKKYVLEYGK